MGAALFSFKLIPQRLLGWTGEKARRDFIRPEYGPRRISVQRCNRTADFTCFLQAWAFSRLTQIYKKSDFSQLIPRINKTPA